MDILCSGKSEMLTIWQKENSKIPATTIYKNNKACKIIVFTGLFGIIGGCGTIFEIIFYRI